MCSSWELEFRDCGAIPRQGLLCEEIDPGYVREVIVVGGAWGPKQGSQGSNTAESCIAGGAMPIASLSPEAVISS